MRSARKQPGPSVWGWRCRPAMAVSFRGGVGYWFLAVLGGRHDLVCFVGGEFFSGCVEFGL